MKRLRRFVNTTLLGGFTILLPLAIFALLVQMLIRLINRVLYPLAALLHQSLHVEIPDILYQFIAFALVIFILFLLGLFVRTQVGLRIFEGIENRYLAKLPFYTAIKKTVQQFVGIKKMPFSEVVLVDAYGAGSWMTGFLTATHPDGYYTVFVPTAPNPTNGFIFHVSEQQIRHLPDVKTEDAMRTIIGMGVGSEKVFKIKSRQVPPPDDGA